MKNLIATIALFFLFSETTSAQNHVFAGASLDSHFTQVKAEPALIIEDNASFTLTIEKDISITLLTSYHIATDRIPFDYTVCDAGIRFNGNIEGRSVSFGTKDKVIPLLKQDSINSTSQTYWGQYGLITTLYHGYGTGGQPGSATGCSGTYEGGPSLWLEKSNRFLGFRYSTDSTNYKYGWIEMSHPTGKSLIVHGYGFESAATLDTALVLTNISEARPMRMPSETVPQLQQSTLSFSGLANGEGIPYRIYGTTGALLSQGEYQGSPIHTALQSGIYIIQYELPEYGQVQSKLYNQ